MSMLSPPTSETIGINHQRKPMTFGRALTDSFHMSGQQENRTHHLMHMGGGGGGTCSVACSIEVHLLFLNPPKAPSADFMTLYEQISWLLFLIDIFPFCLNVVFEFFHQVKFNVVEEEIDPKNDKTVIDLRYTN